MGMKGLMPPNKKDFDEDNYYMSFYEGTEEFLQSVWSSVPGILYDTLKINSGDIDCFIPHQVHKKRTIMAGIAACIPEDKTINIVGDIANCGSVTILVALDHARKNNRLKKDQTALLVAAGGGISWGGLILKT
jgi:3-oxoacyl-[acyl-carrier-protein] synthase-3